MTLHYHCGLRACPHFTALVMTNPPEQHLRSESDPSAASGSVCIRLAPHCALNPRTARWFFASVAIGPLLTAGYCALNGYWPVLPFAGLELAVLAVALYLSMRRRHDSETITITADGVSVETRLRKIHAKTVFSRHWTRVKLRNPPTALHPSRLFLESQGRACEVGRFLTDAERRSLAAELQHWVGKMNESPGLEAYRT